MAMLREMDVYARQVNLAEAFGVQVKDVEIVCGEHFDSQTDTLPCDGDVTGTPNGMEFVRWMKRTGVWPQNKPTVHSANGGEAPRMREQIDAHWRPMNTTAQNDVSRAASDQRLEEITRHYEEILGQHKALQRRVEFVERRLDAVAKYPDTMFGGGRTSAAFAVERAIKQAMATADAEARKAAVRAMLAYDRPEDFYAACQRTVKDSGADEIPAIEVVRDACFRFALTWDEIGVKKDETVK